MNVLILGGSRNIGYYSAQRLLGTPVSVVLVAECRLIASSIAQGSTVTFLLRRGNTFDNDETIAPYIVQGKAKIVEGDALNEADVRRAWGTATGSGSQPVDVVLFTVGEPDNSKGSGSSSDVALQEDYQNSSSRVASSSIHPISAPMLC
jgi:NAD(P)-dependent dehydrogenase (short-subunit alcohol dehydrogenase family)